MAAGVRWKEDDMTGDGPTRVKVRVAERDEAAHEPLIGLLDRGRWKLHPRFRTPPPPLKGRKAGGGGSGMVFIAVDPGALIWAVGEVRPDSGPPPSA
jgi:hypothetical protein